MAALLSDDAEFYARAATAWLLSAALAAAILRGWIRGQGFRARTVHLALLFYSSWLARDSLSLHLSHGIAPKSQRCRGPAPAAAVGVLAIAGRILTMDKASLRVLLWLAAACFFTGLAVGAAVGGAVWGNKPMPATTTTTMPLRPTLLGVSARRGGGLGGVGGLLVEILLFVPCVLSCVHSLPMLILDYMAATADCGMRRRAA